MVPPEDLEAAVDDYVGRLAVAPTSAVGLTKRLFNESPDVDRAGSFVTEAMAQEIQSYSLDAREGVSAFVQKRPPEFVGW